MTVAILVNGQKLSKDYKTTVSDGYGVVDAKNKSYFYTGNNSAIAVKTTKKGVWGHFEEFLDE